LSHCYRRSWLPTLAKKDRVAMGGLLAADIRPSVNGARKGKRRMSSPASLSRGGEIGAAMRAMDWGGTALGPSAAWPEALKAYVALLHASAQAMYVIWGATDQILLYKDAYAVLLGSKHPGALGQSFLMFTRRRVRAPKQ
jgi:hypothetical protein